MNRAIYLNLAKNNLRKNARMVFPYIASSSLTTMMYYMILSLSSNEKLSQVLGGGNMQLILKFGVVVITIFAVIFLFYTNGFLMKQRKKELGLFNVLGMEKGHLTRVIFYESVMMLTISLLAGLGFGILLDKVLYLIIFKMLNMDIILGFYISPICIFQTILTIGVIYGLIFVRSVFQIGRTNPIEWMREERAGQKEPKASVLLTILGFLFLGTGYYLAITVTDPLEAIAWFFVAVVCVIFGTYLLFTTGSIFVLKLLKKKKSFYYQTSHFINVSNMIYRMKQNAVGLANICILSTMVLVTCATTVSLWVGISEVVDRLYTKDVMMDAVNDTDMETLLKDKEIPMEQIENFQTLNFAAIKKEDRFQMGMTKESTDDQVVFVVVVPVQDYNQNMGTNLQVEDDEMVVHSDYTLSDSIQLAEDTYTIKETEKSVMKALQNKIDSYTYPGYIFIVSDATFHHLDQLQKEAYGSHASLITHTLSFDYPKNTEAELYDKRIQEIMEKDPDVLYSSMNMKTHATKEIRSMFAGLLFIGIFLSLLFLMAVVLIMYYKQITEGNEDKKRFEIYKQVGLEKKEIQHTIRTQVLMVFFLPLVTAGMHIIFAFPMIKRLLSLFNMTNTLLFMATTSICFLLFSVVYVLVYVFSAKTYYEIVD